jgi:hypothetical protein
MIDMVHDDFVSFAAIGPIGQITAGAFVQHFRRSGHGRRQFLGLFETFVLTFGDDIGFAALQATADEFASRFQNVFGRYDHLGRGGITRGDEFVQFGGKRSAFGLARFVGHFVHFVQASDARFEISIATQFEQAEEFLHAFFFRRIRASVDACLGFGGNRAHFRPGLFGSDGGRNGVSAGDVIFDERTHLGAAFGRGHFVGRQVTEYGIGAHFGFDRFSARVQARIVCSVVFSEDATKNSQQANNDFHFRFDLNWTGMSQFE